MKKFLLTAQSNYFIARNKSNDIKCLFTLFLFLGFSITVQAQTVATYTYGEVAGGTYTNLSGATDLFGASPNDQQTAVGSEIVIGFTFNFNGTNYTNLRVNANGYLVFGGNAALPNTLPISTTGNYTGAISGYGRDLIYSSYGTGSIYSAVTYPSSVSYLLSGSVGSRVFTVQYRNMARWNSGSTVAPYDGLVNFQIKLYEGTNVVQVVHDAQIVPTTVTALVGQFGLRGASTADFNTRVISSGAPWTSTAFGAVGSGINYRGGTGVQPCYLSAPFTSTWTPPCYAPTVPTVGTITATSAVVGWTAPAIVPPGYNYEVRSSGAAGSGIIGLAASGTVAGVSASATGLADGTTYVLYVRSSCGSAWVTGPTFTTLCGVKTIPYSRNFNEGDYTVPAIPNCLSIQNIGTGNNWISEVPNASSTTAQFTTNHLVYDSTVGSGSTDDANVWVFTPGLALTTGETYKLSYDYGGSTELPSYVNKMLVKYGSAANDAGMTITLVNHDNIKASPLSNNISFTVSSPGTYYIGFKAYSVKANGRLFLDNIQVTKPGCITPSGLSVGSITSSSATATWTAPSPAPGNGYDYYLTAGTSVAATTMTNGTVYQIVTVGTTNYTSFGAGANTVGTIFTASGPATGTGTVAAVPSTPSYTQLVTGSTAAGTNVVNFTGLTGSTAYYLWVRGNCGSNDASQWSAIQSFVTATQLNYCTPTTSSSSSSITNFKTTGGILNINNSTGFSAGAYGNYTAQVVKQVPGGSVTFSIKNNDASLGAGITGWIDWDNSGTFTNSAPDERFYFTSPAAYIFGGPVTGTITVPGGQALGNYRLRIVDDYNSTNPTNPCAFNSGRGEIEDYTFTVSTLPSPLAISSASSIQCAGANSPLITITPATVGNYQVYTWSPSVGVSGNSTSGYTINTSTSQTFTLTGFNTSTFQTNTASFTYTATQPPTAISVSPTTTTMCQNVPAVQLVSSGGTIPGFTVLSEDFNSTSLGTITSYVNPTSPTPTVWSSTNTGSNGTPANASFTVRPNSYSPPTWSGSINSNDSSQFIFTDADSQGSGGTNNTTLISPVFSLATASTATLSFWHFFQRWASGDTFIGVEISTDGGTSWPTVLQSYTTTQGARNNFANVVISLNSYLGQTNLRIRFRYNSVYGYGWAIDNFLITSTTASNTTWNTQTTPVADGLVVPGLYTDSGATVAYVAGTKITAVYALPTTSTTYVASASTSLPSICTVSATSVVNIIPIAAGVASSNQIICGGAAADLVLTGSIGSIQWEYGNNVGFTPAPTVIAGATGTTLTSAQMGGILAADRYFRAVVSVGGCTSSTTNIVSVITSGATATWSAGSWSPGPPGPSSAVIFNSDFTSSLNAGPTGNISACSVFVANNATVIFDKGTLSVENSVTVSSGTLKFDDSSNRDVALYQRNNVANGIGSYNGGNTGNITFLKTTSPMYKFDYTYWSTPVNPQKLLDVSPNSPVGLFLDYTTAWHYISNPATTDMVVGKGYIVRAPNTFNVSPGTPLNYQAPFYGVPNNGNLSIPINGGAGQFNFIGNPYPSALYANDFITANANVSGTLYFWSHNTPINGSGQYALSGDYASYNLSGGLKATNSGAGNNSIPNGYISSGQGFFVKGLTTTPAIFTNSMRRATGNDNFYRFSSDNVAQSDLEKHRYWLDITNSEGAFKEALVAYIETATLGLDRLFDGDLVELSNVISLYTKVDQTKLSIQGRPLPFEVSDFVPLCYKSTIASTYSITMPQYDGLFTEQEVYLEDKVLHVIHDLREGPYTFATEIGTFEDRFVLRYTTQTLGTTTPVFNEQSVVVYKNEQGLFVNTGTAIMKSVTIYDIRGRILAAQKEVGSNNAVFTTLPATQQVLLVKIEGENGTIVTKKIVY